MDGLRMIQSGPMMAKAAGTEMPVVSPTEWALEPKLDGWRFLWLRTTSGVRSFAARNGNEHTGRPGLKEIETHLCDVLVPGDVVDGELLAPFDNRGSAAVAHYLAHDGGKGQLQAWLFDVLIREGVEQIEMPYDLRRDVLDPLAPSGADLNGSVVYHVPHLEPSQAIFDALIDEGLEGVVLKMRSAPYILGRKTEWWVKVKPQQSVEALILGFVPGNGRLEGKAGAFELRILESNVDTTCSTRDDATRADIEANPDRYRGHVCEVAHMGIMRSGKPRHPVFVRLREDRDPKPKPKAVPKDVAPAPETAAKAGLSPARSGTGRIRALKQMGDAKFKDLFVRMQPYRTSDPEAYAKVVAERDRRAAL